MAFSDTQIDEYSSIPKAPFDGYHDFQFTPSPTKAGGVGFFLKETLDFELIPNLKLNLNNAMNKQFTEMGSKLAAKLEPTDANFSDYLKHPNSKSIFLRKATEPETKKHIDEADVNKATGIDNIPAKILKWVIDIIVPILTKLFNICIEKGVYPDSLKLARVMPIFKGGNQNETTSYRPISILTQINRVFEKLLRDRLFDFLGKKYTKNSLGSSPSTQLSNQYLISKNTSFKTAVKR